MTLRDRESETGNFGMKNLLDLALKGMTVQLVCFYLYVILIFHLVIESLILHTARIFRSLAINEMYETFVDL